MPASSKILRADSCEECEDGTGCDAGADDMLDGGCAVSEDAGAGSLGSDDAEMEDVVDFFLVFLLILALRTL
jgi:hypothetical protein